MYPAEFENLYLALSDLPGIGKKSAERMAFTMLSWDEERIEQLVKSLKGIRHLHSCSECGNLTTDAVCEICASSARNHNQICVVKDIKDLYAIESLGFYKGVYHVLNGLINIRKGILPENLNIRSLEDRVNEDTEEVILALDPTIEGDTTSRYLEKLLEEKSSVSKLAYGLPMGGRLDYADPRTLEMALTGRKKSKSDES